MSAEKERLCHPLQCAGDPTKVHHYVEEVWECPTCRAEIEKVYIKRGWVKPQRDYTKVYIS